MYRNTRNHPTRAISRPRTYFYALACTGALLFSATGCVPGEFDTTSDDLADEEREIERDVAEQAGTDEVSQKALLPGETPMPSPIEYSRATTSAGEDWQLDRVSGTLFEEVPALNEDVYIVRGSSGIQAAPLPLTIKQALEADALAATTTTDDDVFMISQDVAAAIAQAEATGQSNPLIEQYGEPVLIDPRDPRDPIFDEPADPYFQSSGKLDDKGSEVGALGSCNDQDKTKTKVFNLNLSTNRSYNLGSGFSGSIGANVAVTGSATAIIRFKAKRKRVLFWCVTYGVKFQNARIYGNINADADASIDGSLNWDYQWEKEIAKPNLGSVSFWIGPVPVYIGFNLPIDLGLDLDASVSASLDYDGGSLATGSFDYTCSLSSCSGSSNYSLGSSTPGSVTAGISGRVQADIWAQASVRAYLYTEWVAYAQVGVRPKLLGDLWGYYGNNCGDADGNGINETVDALTFNLDWQIYLTAKAAAFGGNPRKWNDLWHSNRWHIRFWDLIGSDALRPMLHGPSSVSAGSTNSYTARMRPCWPYNDSTNYRINWGDGSAQTNFLGAAHSGNTRTHAWSQTGSKTVSITAVSDSHGRSFNKTSSRVVNVGGSAATWTPWLDRDNASGNGDYETLSSFVATGQSCSNPTGVQCQTTSGVDWSNTGEVYSCTLSGGVCVNANQPDGYCQDYRVRFLCP